MDPTDRTPSVADVYAGDLDRSGAPRGTQVGHYRFRVEAEAEPDVFGRVANIFTITNRAPQRVRIRTGNDVGMHFTIDYDGLSAQLAELLRGKLRQLVCVTLVEVLRIESQSPTP